MNELSILDERLVLEKQFKVYGTVDEPLFVTRDGRVFRKNKHNKYYKNGVDGEFYELPYFYWSGYKIVNYKGKTYKVHRLVATCYIENPNNYQVVNHKDGNKLNNNVDNLEWCTHQYNTQHAYDTGLAKSKGNSMKGENNPMFGKSHSEKTKQKISNNRKGKEAWNKSSPLDYENKHCTLCQFKRILANTEYNINDFEKILSEKGKNNKYFFKLKKNERCSRMD